MLICAVLLHKCAAQIDIIPKLYCKGQIRTGKPCLGSTAFLLLYAQKEYLMVLLFYSAVSDVQVSFSMIVNELASGSLARVQRHAAFFHSIKQISPEQPSLITRSRVS